jgi:hypothetical protein
VSRHIERIVHVAASPAEVFMRLEAHTWQHGHEAVTERVHPRRKAWKSHRDAAPLLIDAYTMGYAVAPENGGTQLRIWMDYTPTDRLLAPPLAAVYARWRVDDLAQDAADGFTDMTAAVTAHP